jgi:hypothetical protein
MVDCVSTANSIHRDIVTHMDIDSVASNKNKLHCIRDFFANVEDKWSMVRVHLEWDNGKCHEYIVKRTITDPNSLTLYDSYIDKRDFTTTQISKGYLLCMCVSFNFFAEINSVDEPRLAYNSWVLPLI